MGGWARGDGAHAASRPLFRSRPAPPTAVTASQQAAPSAPAAPTSCPSAPAPCRWRPQSRTSCPRTARWPAAPGQSTGSCARAARAGTPGRCGAQVGWRRRRGRRAAGASGQGGGPSVTNRGPPHAARLPEAAGARDAGNAWAQLQTRIELPSAPSPTHTAPLQHGKGRRPGGRVRQRAHLLISAAAALMWLNPCARRCCCRACRQRRAGVQLQLRIPGCYHQGRSPSGNPPQAGASRRRRK